MKIVINARYLTAPYSGIGQYTINLLKSLAKIDKENEYILFVPWPVDMSFGSNFKIVDIREGKLFNNDFISRLWWEQITLSRALRKYNPDVYHSTYQTLPRRSGKYHPIATIHDAIPWKFAWQQKNRMYRFYSNVSRRSSRRLELAFCVSEAAKLDVAHLYGIKPERMIVTYEGVSDEFYNDTPIDELNRTKKKYSLTRPFFYYVGGFKRHKNLRVLIKSFANAVHKNKINYDLVIPGKIREHSGLARELFYDVKSLVRYAKSKGVSDRVKFIGYASQKELAALYKLSHAFITLSLYEGFGLPALEAMVSGKPVIVSDVGAHPEVVGKAGILVYPYGITRITNAISSIATNKILYAQLVEEGKKQIMKFDKIKIAKNVLKHYEEIAKLNK